MGLLTVENQAGSPIQAGERRIVPFNQVIRLQIPGLQGGLIWNRPYTVLVQEKNGAEIILPVIDITRRAQVLLLAIGLLIGLLFRLRSKD